VPAAIAAKRIGNPARKAFLPGGRVPSYRKLQTPSADQTDTSGKHEELHHVLAKLSGSIEAHPKNHHENNVRPVSPKIHHLDLIPGTKDHPFVHRREVNAHMAAIRAGAPSPLRRSIDGAQHVTSINTRDANPDYSRTVFYGTTASSVSARRLSPDTILQQVHAAGTIVIEEGRQGGIPLDLQVELENSGVYRRRSPQEDRASTIILPPIRDDDETFSTLTTQTPSTIGGTRLELKGGNNKPLLRGGRDRRFKFRRWLLTCRANDSDSDDDLPPPRAPAPERIARAIRESHGTAALPSNLSRSSTISNTRERPGKSTEHTIPAVPPLPDHFVAHPPDASLKKPDASSQNQTGPSLRGGAGSEARLPPTLYWLAGGKGKPITVSSWQKTKHKKRRGGLLGMAMYGSKYGKDYAESDVEEGDATSITVEVGYVKNSEKESGGSVKTRESRKLSGSSASVSWKSPAGGPAGTPTVRFVHEQPVHTARTLENPPQEQPVPVAVLAEEATPTPAAGNAPPHEVPVEQRHGAWVGEGEYAAHAAAENLDHVAQASDIDGAVRNRSV
jgi:hypothetical protein